MYHWLKYDGNFAVLFGWVSSGRVCYQRGYPVKFLIARALIEMKRNVMEGWISSSYIVEGWISPSNVVEGSISPRNVVKGWISPCDVVEGWISPSNVMEG